MVQIPPATGETSFVHAFEMVVEAMLKANLAPFPLVPAEGLAAADSFSRVVYLRIEERDNLAWVIDAPLAGDRIDALLHDVYAVSPQALLHLYSAYPLPSVVRQVLADDAIGLLARICVHDLELHTLEVDEAPEVAEVAARVVSALFERELDLNAPEETLRALDEILLEARAHSLFGGEAGPEAALAAIGLVAAEAVRRALPGTSFGLAPAESEEAGETLWERGWSFPLYRGEARLDIARQAFWRYRHGESFTLSSFLPGTRAGAFSG